MATPETRHTAIYNIPADMTWHLTSQGRKLGCDITDIVGVLPTMICRKDQPAQDQIAANYPFGGWDPLKGFAYDDATMQITYPGDPPMDPLAFVHLDDQMVNVYESGWVAVLDHHKDPDTQDDHYTLVGVTRMD